MALRNDKLRLPPTWISPAAGMPDREVRPVIIVQRRRLLYPAYVQDYLDRVTAADVAAGDTNGLELMLRLRFCRIWFPSPTWAFPAA
jgi:hypothetical protein